MAISMIPPEGAHDFIAEAGWEGGEILPLAGDASFRRYFRVVRGAQPGGPDQDGLFRLLGGAQMLFQRFGRAEIDQHVGFAGQRRGVGAHHLAFADLAADERVLRPFHAAGKPCVGR